MPVFRNNLPELFDVFDFPDPSLAAGAPGESTLATQALLLMNHPWVVERSTAAGKRWAASSSDPDAGIRAAYLASFAREPDPSELSLAREFLGTDPDERTWTAFAQSLFASIEFRHTD